MRAVHLEPLPDWIRTLIREGLPDAIEMQWLDADGRIEGADVLLTAKQHVTSAIIEAACPTLRLIQIQGRTPWVVDLSAAVSAGIPVSSIPHRGAIAVAEHTMALILAVKRKIVLGHVGTVNASYTELGVEPIRTSERKIAFNWLKLPAVEQLYGSTLGLIGLGDIGLEVARRARAFDVDVVYNKRQRLPEEAERMAGVRYEKMDHLLATADVVSLHAPHTPETEGLIDGAALAKMRPDAILVNTSRGGLVDEQALVTALRDGVIAAAGLDVFVDEPLPLGHDLLKLDNVTLSPHTGGGTGGGQRAMVADVIENLVRLSQGEPLNHVMTYT